MGNKELREYMEVTGYASGAKWVYGQALEPGEWTSRAPLTMTEIRYVHQVALDPVWGVAPHPNSTPEEKPGSFRRHEIQAFPGGMTPPSWIEVPAAMTDRVDSFATIKANAKLSLATKSQSDRDTSTEFMKMSLVQHS